MVEWIVPPKMSTSWPPEPEDITLYVKKDFEGIIKDFTMGKLCWVIWVGLLGEAGDQIGREVTSEAAVGMIPWSAQAKECQQPLDTGEARRNSPQEPQEGASYDDTLTLAQCDFVLLASRTI